MKNLHHKIVFKNIYLIYRSCGTLSGRYKLLTTGGMSPGFGNAGVLAHNAALVNCDTSENFLSFVLNTRFNFDLIPLDGIVIGTCCTGIILPCSTFVASSGSLPHLHDVLSIKRCLENLSIVSAQI